MKSDDLLYVGDIIMLKSGSPKMTVIEVLNSGDVTAAFYSESEKNFVIFKGKEQAFKKTE
ncbi:DUF2158 domain-containing protein [Myroides marinus]|uniref:DUF2158 domain-containing protein n=1 Tax=Myroides marinus TaxID=703342 RepID=UPI002577B7F5|nr:DUF2158 domain-containing protein [Myroides marinus]MDM1345712.1 DUF2158 domain-containing protein [Myroides marinus]